MTRPAWGLGVLLGLSACRPDPVTPPPAGPPPGDDVVGSASDADNGQPTAAAPPKKKGRCGSEGLRFEDYDWIPAGTRVAVSIAVWRAETQTALQALAERGKAPSNGLPIKLAFGVQQWPFVVPVLGTLLDSVGLAPDELVYLEPARGPAFAWILRADCDLDDAIERVNTEWGLVARRRVEGVVASSPGADQGDGTLVDPPKPEPPPAKSSGKRRGKKRGKAKAPPAEQEPPAPTPTPQTADGEEPFPFDLVFASGGRVALVPHGFGDVYLTTMSERPAAGASTAWTAMLQEIDSEASVRGVLAGPALVGSGGTPKGGTQALSVRGDEVALQSATQ